MATATSDNDTRLPGLPRYVRINTLKTSRSEAAKSLTATGHIPEQQSTYRAARKGDAPAESSNRSYVPDAHVPDLLVFKPKGQSDISRIPLVASGALVVQQKASCFPAVALAPPPGAHVIDGCAAPGNKTCHIAALMGGRGSVVVGVGVGVVREQGLLGLLGRRVRHRYPPPTLLQLPSLDLVEPGC